MNLSTSQWSTPEEKVLAASVVERLKVGLAVGAEAYETACKPFIEGNVKGSWSWYESALFHQRVLVTDIYEDVKGRMGFDGMAVSWKRLDKTFSPPLIQSRDISAVPIDVLEHEAIHVAQMIENHEEPERVRGIYPGPIPKMSERILLEFEAYLVQSVNYKNAFDRRLILDFGCFEASQMAALRASFDVYVGKCVCRLIALGSVEKSLTPMVEFAEQIRAELSEFGGSIKAVFRDSVLEDAGVVPSLDQLAFHLLAQVEKHIGRVALPESKKRALAGIFVPIFESWTDYRGDDLFEILERFRPPKAPPRLNKLVID